MSRVFIMFGILNIITITWYLIEKASLSKLERRRVTLTYKHFARTRTSGLAVVVTMTMAVVGLLTTQF